MTYVREVTKLTCLVICVYISSLTQFVYFLSLFELVNLLSITYTPLMILEIASVFSVSTNHHQHYDPRRLGSNLSLLAR